MNKLLAVLALVVLASCTRTVTVPEPKTFKADILILVDSSAPPGFWLHLVSAGDTANKIQVDHYDNARCVGFMADSIPASLYIIYGGINTDGQYFTRFDKLIWAPSYERNHLTIFADKVTVHVRTNVRAQDCGKDE